MQEYGSSKGDQSGGETYRSYGQGRARQGYLELFLWGAAFGAFFYVSGEVAAALIGDHITIKV